MVQVLLRDSRSMRRSLRAPKRASADSGRYSTLAVSPSTATATALQKSTSNPRQTPELSFSENPGRPSLTPQISLPSREHHPSSLRLRCPLQQLLRPRAPKSHRTPRHHRRRASDGFDLALNGLGVARPG